MTGPAFVDSLPAPLSEGLRRVLVELPSWLINPDIHFFWLYLLTSALIGAWAWRLHYRGTHRPVLSFLFPREVYAHPSARLDYQLFLVNRFFGPSAWLTRVVLGSGLIAGIGSAAQSSLAAQFGAGHALFTWSVASSTVVVIVLALVRDFSTFATHALSHRVPLLWEFHKVHHSAEVLTPITLFRKHPVYNLVANAVDLVLVAPLQGLVAWLFVGEATPLTLFGANLVFSLFHLAGANLRHSHIWLSFGPHWGRIFISPAQHQIHHSRAPQHWDRNFGEVFALWDWMFGTLYLPGRTPEPLEFGVADMPPGEHGSLWRLYWIPFANCGRIIRGWFRPRMLPGGAGAQR